MNVNTCLFTLINSALDPFLTIRTPLHIIPERTQNTLFLRRSEATLLNLSSVGEKETMYGVLPQYEALELVVLNDHAQRIDNVVELPAELEGRYGAGLVGSDVMWKCGVTLAWDRGKVALVDHEKSTHVFSGADGGHLSKMTSGLPIRAEKADSSDTVVGTHSPVSSLASSFSEAVIKGPDSPPALEFGSWDDRSMKWVTTQRRASDGWERRVKNVRERYITWD
ncbi:hypothetical protein BJ742DRAFT_767645 [Cladochytrium replicatum]|nr:hypothetical protein BJ742DRAFT_767645 [Cladochytrium replicatum]